MSRGFLVHAYNNMEIDYGTMSLCSALLIKKHLLNNKVALVTDIHTLEWMKGLHGDLVDRAFDHIIPVQYQDKAPTRIYFDTMHSHRALPYRNANRVDSYDITPFEETVIVDSDYLILDDSIDRIWGNAEDIAVNNRILTLDHRENPGGFDKRLNTTGIPLYWATLLYFRKGHRAKSLFDTMRFIKENFDYYQRLFQFSESGYFRNDYALSIAIHMLYGQFENDPIPSFPSDYHVVATEQDDMVGFRNGNAYFIREGKPGQFTAHKVMTNVHVMNKWSVNRMAQRIINYATS